MPLQANKSNNINTSSSSAVRSCGNNTAVSSSHLGSNENHHLTSGTITVTTSTSNGQRHRSHTTNDITYNPPNTSLSPNTLRTATTGSGSGGSHHLWNVDLTDLSYVTHMQRVRARASFARQMSNSTDIHRRRRESIAAVNFPVHLTSSGSGLNMMASCKSLCYYIYHCLYKVHLITFHIRLDGHVSINFHL